MKNILSIAIVLTLLSSCNKSADKNADGQNSESQTTFNTPEKYNDFIVGLTDNVGREIAMLSIFVWSPVASPTDLDSGLIRLKSECDKSLKSISGLKDYEGNVELRDGMKDLLEYYQGLTKNEFPTLIGYAKTGFQDSPDSVKVQEIFDRMDKSESAIIDRVGKIQEAFASKYGINLEEGGEPMDPTQLMEGQ